MEKKAGKNQSVKKQHYQLFSQVLSIKVLIGVLYYVLPHGGAHASYYKHLYPLVSSQGEICLCTSRIFVERSIYPEFLAKFVEAARQWKTGLPSDPSNHNGALVSKEHLEKVRQSHN